MAGETITRNEAGEVVAVSKTTDELSSVEVTKDAKGAYKWVIKLYFADEAPLEEIKRIDGELRNRFGG